MSNFYEKTNKNAEKIARAIGQWVKDATPEDLVNWIEENWGHRINIRCVDLGHMQCSGYVQFDPTTNGYNIFIEKMDAYVRRRFTLCHEIGHILVNHALVYGFFEKDGLESKKKQERFCNRFAAAFLMPAEKFINEWTFNAGISEGVKILQIALKFRVSPEAARYRAIELDLLTI